MATITHKTVSPNCRTALPSVTEKRNTKILCMDRNILEIFSPATGGEKGAHTVSREMDRHTFSVHGNVVTLKGDGFYSSVTGLQPP